MYNHTHLAQISAAGTTLRTPTARKIQWLLLSTLLLGAGLTATPAFAAIAPPSAPDLIASCDSGASNTDNNTNVTQLTFTGTGVPLATVTLRAGGAEFGYDIGSGIVSPSGKWSISLNAKPLGERTHVIFARQTLGGVQSPDSSALNIYIDTIKPHPPSAPDMIARHDHGSSNFDNITNLRTPTFEGTSYAEDGNYEYIYLYSTSASSTVPIGHMQIPSTTAGKWSYPVSSAFSAGTHSYSIRAEVRDLAGNVSALSDATDITIDTDKPGAAEIPDLIAADDSGALHNDNITNVMQPTFAVTGDPYAKIELYSAGISPTFLGSAVTNQYGTALVKTSKPLIGNQIYAINYDTAGNAATQSSPTLNITIDTTPPIVSKPALLASSDGGTQGDNLTNDNTPTIGGTCDDLSASVEIYAAQGENGKSFAGKLDSFSGHWEATTAVLKDGTYEIGALATDLAGNVGKSSTFNLTIDTAPPAKPSMPDLLAADDTGASNSDNITNKQTLSFSGTAPASSKVALFNNAVKVGETTSNAAGKWTIKAMFAQSGPLHVTATTYDKAGNASVSSPQLNGMIDLTNPSVALKTPTDSAAKNLNVLSGTTADSDANMDASGIAKLTLNLCRLDTNANWSGSAWSSANTQLPLTVVNGSWSKTTGLPLVGSNPLTQLQAGDYKITLVATDKAGNTSNESTYITIDTSAPTIAIGNSTQNAEWTGIHPIIGTATDNIGVDSVRVSIQRKRGNVMFYWDGTAFTTVPLSIPATVTTAGNKSVTWNCSVPLPKTADLDTGVYLIYAASYDAAGNLKISAPFSIMVTPNGSTPEAKQFYSGGSS